MFILDNGKCREGGNWYELERWFFEDDEFVFFKGWRLEHSVGGEKDPFTKCG